MIRMAAEKRVRSVGSVADELIKKSREAALASVQIFNNPALTFKSEIFIVLMMISWTYLLHAFIEKMELNIDTSRWKVSESDFTKLLKVL